MYDVVCSVGGSDDKMTDWRSDQTWNADSGAIPDNLADHARASGLCEATRLR